MININFTLGVILLLVPVVLIFVDPIMIIAKYKLRITEGSMLHHTMMFKINGPVFSFYLFNVTNAREFMDGLHDKLKLDEIGPFVFQEYRKNKDVVIDSEAGVMRYEPKLWMEFVPEKSIGRPKDYRLVMPCVPMLGTASLFSKYPAFMRNIFNAIAAGVNAKPFITISAHDFLMGYPHKLLKLGNTLAPGLIYYNSTGMVERALDSGVNYKMEMGITDANKFKVLKVQKIREHSTDKDLIATTQTFSDTYEGAAFPSDLTPDYPLFIYRHGLCKIFKPKFVGTRSMDYGSDAFVYDLDDEQFLDHNTCDTKGWCPDGLLDVSPCYCNFPFSLSRGHFFNGDPRLYERFEGIRPDKHLHSSELVIDPKIGVTMSVSASIQLNLAVGNVEYNKECRGLTDLIIPISHIKLNNPEMMEEVKYALGLFFTKGPYILLAIEILSVISGLCLLGYSSRVFYLRKMSLSQGMVFNNWQKSPSFMRPLLKRLKREESG